MANDEGARDALRDAKARLSHNADQGQAATMAFAQTVAGFFLGLATNGVPAQHAAHITAEYVRSTLAAIHANPNNDQPPAAGGGGQ